MAQDDGLGDLGGAATGVSLVAVGGWVVLRLVKFVSGKLDAEEKRAAAQDAEVVELRKRVGELAVETAKCHAERDSNREALARADKRIEDLERRLDGHGQ